MSLALDFLLQLSRLCTEELSTTGRRGETKRSARRTKETKSQFSISNTVKDDRCLRVSANVKIKDDSSTSGVQEQQKDDFKILKKSPTAQEYVMKVERSPTPDSDDTYCSQCRLAFTKRQTYLGHLLTDKHLGLTRCEKCKEKIHYNQMEEHLNSVHSTSSPVFKTLKRLDDGQCHCTKCDMILISMREYRRHIGTVIHKGRCCKYCKFRTQSVEEMEQHFIEVHGNMIKHMCKVCGSGFSTLPLLERHMDYSHIVGQLFRCPICDVCFTRKHNLIRHREEFHSTMRPYACDKCALTFKYKRNLVQHYAVHIKGRHQCTVCFKSFEDVIDLEIHEKFHRGAFFNCMVCGKSFPTFLKRERHLEGHMNPGKRKILTRKEGAVRVKCDDSEMDTSYLSTSEKEYGSTKAPLSTPGQAKRINTEVGKGLTHVAQNENPEKSASTGNSSVPLSKCKVSCSATLMEDCAMSKTVNGIALCKKVTTDNAVKTSASLTKIKKVTGSSVESTPPFREKKEVNRNVSFSKDTSVIFDKNIKKAQTSIEKRNQSRSSADKPPVLEIKHDNAACDKIRKENFVKVETASPSLSNVKKLALAEDSSAGLVTHETARNTYSDKRNYADAADEDVNSTLEIPVKKRRKSSSLKENSPLSENSINGANETFSQLVNSTDNVFKGDKRKVSGGCKSSGKLRNNLLKNSKAESNGSGGLIEKDRKFCQISTSCKSERETGKNCVNPTLQSSAVPPKIVNLVPKLRNVGEPIVICNNGISKTNESGNGEDGLVEGQIIEIKSEGWTETDEFVVELNSNVIVIDRPYDGREALVNSGSDVKVNFPTTWPAPPLGEEAVLINTETNDFVTIPVDGFISQVDPLFSYVVPDTDSCISVLHVEDLNLDNTCTYIVSDGCAEVVETVHDGQESKKKRSKKSQRQKKPSAKKEKRVLMRNLCTDSDDFSLPEFAIEEDSEES